MSQPDPQFRVADNVHIAMPDYSAEDPAEADTVCRAATVMNILNEGGYSVFIMAPEGQWSHEPAVVDNDERPAWSIHPIHD